MYARRLFSANEVLISQVRKKPQEFEICRPWLNTTCSFEWHCNILRVDLTTRKGLNANQIFEFLTNNFLSKGVTQKMSTFLDLDKMHIFKYFMLVEGKK